jgi:hypothetical protein
LLVKLTPRNVNLGNGRFAMFNKERDILPICAIGSPACQFPVGETDMVGSAQCSLMSVLRLRLLVGFLGERAQFGWWPTAFYEPSGRLFLEPIFSKTAQSAQCHGVVEAARRLQTTT